MIKRDSNEAWDYDTLARSVCDFAFKLHSVENVRLARHAWSNDDAQGKNSVFPFNCANHRALPSASTGYKTSIAKKEDFHTRKRSIIYLNINNKPLSSKETISETISSS